MSEDVKEKTLIGPKTKEETAAELAQSMAANAAKSEEMADALEVKDNKVLEELTGKDLDFDIRTLITYGAIRKENLKIMDGFYIDMQTITQREKILAEQLVKSRFGNLLATDNVYANTLEVAMLAMAITRINNREYPIPATSPRVGALADSAQLEKRTLAKQELYDTLLDANERLTSALSSIYNRLELADVLKEQREAVDVAKK